MATNQITWEQFVLVNQTAQGVKLKFEDLCRQLFINEFLSNNTKCRYIHSNPNNFGLEADPVYDELNERNIGYQAKFFDNRPDYGKILDSAKKVVEYYPGKVDTVFLYCNKPLDINAKRYVEAVNILQEAEISIELITDDAILDRVRKYPYLGIYYFGYRTIEHEWFVKHTNYMLSNLGDRFNNGFNVDTKYSKYLSLFLHDKSAIDYLNGKKKKLIEELDNLDYGYEKYDRFIKELRKAVDSLPDVCEDNILDVFKWYDEIQEIILPGRTILEAGRNDIETELENYRADILKNDDTVDDDKEEYNKENRKNAEKEKYYLINDQLYRIRNLLEMPGMIDINIIERKLLTSSFLPIKGDAGIGKSQLLAHEAEVMLKEDRDVLLLLGGSYLSSEPVQHQIMRNLSLEYSFEELVDIMEAVGQRENRIVPIMIDALNETWHQKLWKTSILELVDVISSRKYVKLVVTYRKEYERNLLSDTLIDRINAKDIFCMVHNGFNDNSIEAVQEFMNYYKIPFTPLDYFGYEMTNPLFLTLYCKTYRGDEVDLPILYDRILEYANGKLHDTMSGMLMGKGYEGTEDLLTPLIEELTEFLFEKERRFVTKKELSKFDYWADYGIAAAPFIIHLIKEHILWDSENNGEEVLYFSYDQMNDYYIARTIVSRIDSKEEVREYLAHKVLGIVDGQVMKFENIELFVNACALYMGKYGEECIEIIDDVTDEYDRKSLFEKYIESFQWRRRDSISLDALMEMLKKYPVEKDVVWKMYIGNSIKVKHPLNADFLHDSLMRYALNRRDYQWTTYINRLSVNEDNRIVRLIQMYNKGQYLETSETKQTELLLMLFAWLLSSSDRWLRDITSKAMIEILKRNFTLCEVLLRKFRDVNDPYVIQRLYGIVFGACCKRINRDEKVYLSLSEYVYSAVFDQDKVYPDILLRDYARLIIERYLWEYPGLVGIIDREKIVPPYNSETIPDVEEQDYSGDDYGSGTSSIISSMGFEGMGWYGDFGRYVFQSALYDFEVDHKKIHDYALSFIFDELGYEDEYFETAERYISRHNYNRYDTMKVERIGKKYQWIAMYNILARITDNCVMRERFGDREKLQYEGAWEPYVRDFDPTLNSFFMSCPDAPFFDSVEEHKKDIMNKRCDFDINNKKKISEWIDKKSNFMKYIKEDLILTDSSGDKWVNLIRYADTDHEKMKEDNLLSWAWVYGYFMSEKQADELMYLADKKIDFKRNNYVSINEAFTIYNREYPWSPSCKSFRETAWMDLEIAAGKKRYINVLAAASNLLWEEGYDASKQEAVSWYVPCAEIIEDLKLRQHEYDGFYYDQSGKLAAFDTKLNRQKAGCVIRKDVLDSFLKGRNMQLVWLIDSSKEIHGADLAIIRSSEWSAALLYDSENVQGDIYRVKDRYC